MFPIFLSCDVITSPNSLSIACVYEGWRILPGSKKVNISTMLIFLKILITSFTLLKTN